MALKTVRFDLEEAIMAAWQTENDIKLAVESLYEEEKIDNDKFFNLVYGIAELHGSRMNKVWDLFEKYSNEKVEKYINENRSSIS